MFGVGCLLAVFSFVQRAAAQEANSNANTAASPSPSPTATPIPISSIVSEADKADAKIAEIRAFLDSRPDNFRITAGLADTGRQIDARVREADATLADSPSLDELNSIENRFKALERTIEGWASTLATQTSELEERVQSVRDLRSLWQRSIESYSGAAANTSAGDELVPQEALRRANGTVFSLGELLREVERRRADVIDLQSKVSDLQTRVEKPLATIRDRRATALENLFEQKDPAIWNAGGWSRPASAATSAIGASLGSRWRELSSYFQSHPGAFAGHAVIIILFALVLAWAGRKFRPIVEEEPELERASTIFRHPIASAILLSIFVASFLYSGAPGLLTTLLGIAVIVPAVYLLRLLIDGPLHVILYGLVVLFLTDRIRDLVAADEFVARLIFLVELLVAALFLVWFRRSKRLASKVTAADQRLFSRLRWAVSIAAILFGLAFAANATGFTSLSEIMGSGLLRSAYAALILYAVYELLKGVVVFILRVRPLSTLTMVRNNRTLVRMRAMQCVWLGLILIWLLVLLRVFSIRDLVFDWLGSFFSASFEIGSLTISAGHILGFVAAVWIAFLLSRFLRFVLEEDVYPRIGVTGGVSYAVSTIVHYFVLVAGFLLAIAALGFQLSQFAFIAGAIGIGVGFGLQNIINNFVSGLILLFERPVKVGDTVQISEHIGSLTQIGLRASVLRKVDGSDVILPNSQLISEEVVNWTMSDEKRRLDIPVGVAYGTDPKRVLELLTKTGLDNKDIMDEPQPRALFIGFGDSSLDFELRAWTDKSDDWVQIRSDLVTSINEILTAENIEIPFPQRDVNIKNMDKDVLKS